MSTREKLGWGAERLVPEEAPAAWGARLIVTQTGQVDMLGDRQDLTGGEDATRALLDVLKETPWREALILMLLDREVETQVAKDVTVYEDDKIKVAGNSNASYGYFYVSAWLK